MEYFQILNLKKEPFSNSPEPEFFLQVNQHIRCLQQLELATRLNRGLNVVIGEVGTGKTTLCRELIQRLNRISDKNGIETHLILDPSFFNANEFLSEICRIFGLPQQESSEWQKKDSVKKYIFNRVIERGKSVVLIIDEAQKLSAFCVETLREFLNYETNDRKLLQIILFAQPEFERTLAERPNFADRINLLVHLKPLSLFNTKKMIEFRIAKAGDGNSPGFFTWPAYLAVYIGTKGYPRKIVNLCHQVLLTLIIQNRARAGWRLVRASTRRLAPARKWRSYIVPVGATALATILVVTFPRWSRDFNRPAKIVSQASTQAPAVPKAAEIPKLLGDLRIKQGRTLWKRLSDIYGEVNPELLKQIAAANPDIPDLNQISAGEVVRMPVPKPGPNPLSSESYWVKVAAMATLQEAYDWFERNRGALPPLSLVSYWNAREGMIFGVFLVQGFSSDEEAGNAIRRLPPTIGSGARVATGDWVRQTVFLTRA